MYQANMNTFVGFLFGCLFVHFDQSVYKILMMCVCVGGLLLYTLHMLMYTREHGNKAELFLQCVTKQPLLKSRIMAKHFYLHLGLQVLLLTF